MVTESHIAIKEVTPSWGNCTFSVGRSVTLLGTKLHLICDRASYRWKKSYLAGKREFERKRRLIGDRASLIIGRVGCLGNELYL